MKYLDLQTALFGNDFLTFLESLFESPVVYKRK